VPEAVNARVARLGRTIRPNTVVISKPLAQALNLKNGDVVKLTGRNKETAAPVSGIEDSKEFLVYPDGHTRINANASFEEEVMVRRIEVVEPAKSVVVGPAAADQVIEAETPIVKERLNGSIVHSGKVVTLPNHSFLVNQEHSPNAVLIIETKPNGIVRIVPETDLTLKREYCGVGIRRVSDVTYDEIGGLQEQIELLRYVVEIPLRNVDLIRKLGIDPPKGILLQGPPGSGKTRLVKAVVNETNIYAVFLQPTDLAGPPQEVIRKIGEAFEEAKQHAPAVVVIEEIDTVARKRDQTYDPDSPKILGALLTEMDGLKGRGDVVVIATTNRRDALDEALRRPGRFDLEIVIPIPTLKQRLEILRIHTRKMPLADDVDLENLAQQTHGYTGADLLLLCELAATNWLKRHRDQISPDGIIDPEACKEVKVTAEDFQRSLTLVTPTCGREFFAETPQVKWEDVGGLGKVKKDIWESIIRLIKYRKEAELSGTKLPKGILLFGPPGVGKTYIAKAIATATGMKVIVVRGSTILSKWLGDSEANVKRIFETARKAAPVLLIFDEIDSIGSTRTSAGSAGEDAKSSILNELLTQIDGVQQSSDIIIIATTNRPDRLDPALTRPGRIEIHVFIPEPDKEGRKEIFAIHMKGLKLAEDVDVDQLAELTNKQTGAGIELIVREASKIRLNDCIDRFESRLNTEQKSQNKKDCEQTSLVQLMDETPISQEHFLKAIEKITKQAGGSD
jgi:transitional endoplasmic reticulum ATPase